MGLPMTYLDLTARMWCPDGSILGSFWVDFGHFGSILDLGALIWTPKGVQDPTQPVDWGPFGGRLSRDV